MCKKLWVNLACKYRKNILPYSFFTCSIDVGKSNLVKSIFKSVSKELLFKIGNLEKIRALLLASASASGININGITVDFGYCY